MIRFGPRRHLLSQRIQWPKRACSSGTTAMLLGSALAGVGLVRRYLKR